MKNVIYSELPSYPEWLWSDGWKGIERSWGRGWWSSIPGYVIAVNERLTSFHYRKDDNAGDLSWKTMIIDVDFISEIHPDDLMMEDLL